jgi:hypothetical protein
MCTVVNAEFHMSVLGLGRLRHQNVSRLKPRTRSAATSESWGRQMARFGEIPSLLRALTE